MEKMVVDCSTGQSMRVAMTVDEHTRLEQERAAWAASDQAEEAQIALELRRAAKLRRFADSLPDD